MLIFGIALASWVGWHRKSCLPFPQRNNYIGNYIGNFKLQSLNTSLDSATFHWDHNHCPVAQSVPSDISCLAAPSIQNISRVFIGRLFLTHIFQTFAVELENRIGKCLPKTISYSLFDPNTTKWRKPVISQRGKRTKTYTSMSDAGKFNDLNYDEYCRKL